MYGKDWRYAATRLVGSIVRWKKTPVTVQEVYPDGTVVVESIAKGAVGRANMDDLNLKPVPLGFVNYEKQASYVSRVPKRRDWRQGLRVGNMTSFGIPQQIIPGLALSKTIKGIYPTYESTLGRVRDRGGSHAWHRHWAINEREEILYKHGVVVGKIERGRPLLSSKYEYLQEYLEECL